MRPWAAPLAQVCSAGEPTGTVRPPVSLPMFHGKPGADNPLDCPSPAGGSGCDSNRESPARRGATRCVVARPVPPRRPLSVLSSRC